MPKRFFLVKGEWLSHQGIAKLCKGVLVAFMLAVCIKQICYNPVGDLWYGFFGGKAIMTFAQHQYVSFVPSDLITIAYPRQKLHVFHIYKVYICPRQQKRKRSTCPLFSYLSGWVLEKPRSLNKLKSVHAPCRGTEHALTKSL